MSAPVRYTTSFVATICHIVSGLSIIAAVLWFVPAIAFFVPGVVTGLGQSVGLDLSGFVTGLQNSALISTVTLLGSFVLFVAGFLALKEAGDRLYAMGQPTTAATRSAGDTQQASATQQAGQAGTHQRATGGASKDYVAEFGKMSYVMAVFVGLVYVALSFLISGSPLAAAGLGSGVVQLLGLFALVYALAGFGARKGSMEAVIVGTFAYSVNLLGGLVSLNPFGVMIGAFGVYYGARSLLSGRLELLVLDSAHSQLSSGDPQHAGSGRSAQQSGPGGQHNTYVTEPGAGQNPQAGQTPQTGQGQSAPQNQHAQHGPGAPMETHQVAPGEQTDRDDEPDTTTAPGSETADGTGASSDDDSQGTSG